MNTRTVSSNRDKHCASQLSARLRAKLSRRIDAHLAVFTMWSQHGPLRLIPKYCVSTRAEMAGGGTGKMRERESG